MTSAGAVLTEQAARLTARADQVALCLDFDGTLSPIVPDPEAARPLEGMVKLLGRLATRFAAVALVSGRPAVPSDKGDAVRKLVASSGARSVVVAGDDLGDLAAFAAAAQLAAEGGEALRVAVASAEAPERLLAEADLVVDGPPGLRAFLKRLADRPVAPR